MNKSIQYICSAIFGVSVFLFWWLLHPGAMAFHEQNQLFLFTWDYLAERMVVAGGLADYIAEFITQFNYIPVLGEVLIAILFVIFQRSIARTIGKDEWYLLSFIAPVMMLAYMSDFFVLLSYMVALTIAVQLCALYRKHPNVIWSSIATVLGYWLIGPAVFVFTVYAALKERNKYSFLLISLAIATVVVSRLTYMHQYPWKTVICGVNYYRRAVTVPAMQVCIPIVSVLPAVLSEFLPRPKAYINALLGLAVVAGGVWGIHKSYNKDIAELVAYENLVRHEDWNTVLKRAEKYQPNSELGSVTVNLALIMSGRGAELPEFKQYGTRGLIQPRVRDYLSNSASSEVFWRLGMINECLRYAFDTQESLVNNRKSGRWMSRIAECQMLNGRYDAAEKYLDILSHSLFYRKWAENQRQYLRDEEAIMSNNVYAYLKTVRYKEDFLFFYPEMDKMLAKLYFENNNNVVAAWYYQAWTAFKKNESNVQETHTGNAHGN